MGDILHATSFWRRLGALLFVLPVLFFASHSNASVDGIVPQPLQSFRVFGTAIPIGNTLMSNTAGAPQVNSILLASSSAQVSGIPADAQIVRAFLWWSGSINFDPNLGPTGVDDTADLDLPNGTHIEDLPAQTCQISNAFNGFFYCRADVTNQLAAQTTANGVYTVGEVISQPGNVQLGTANCAQNDPACQSRYAGWSMVVVFNSPTQPSQRDVILYDGFLNFDENQSSGLVPPINVSGFEVGAPGLADLSFFALEGDAQLGVPPQSLKSTQDPLFCTSCRDFFELQTNTSPRTTLTDSFNPSGNLFNSSDALGIDIDTYNVGVNGLNILQIGNTSATFFIGSGDGVIEPNTSHGGGESVFMGWVLLTLTRPSPNFRGTNTKKVVDFTTAAPGQVLTYTLQVANDGDQIANNVVLRDSIPAKTTYVPGSTRVNGVAVADVAGTSPVASAGGLLLGTLNPVTQGGALQTVTFQVRIDTNATGTITNAGNLSSTEVNPAVVTNTVVTTIAVPTLGIPEKRVTDLTAPIGEFRPGDLVSYTITVKGSAQSPVGGIQFVDDMPAFLRLVSVTEPGGSTNNSLIAVGGANGTGRIDVRNITLTQGGTANISAIAQVFSEAEFNGAGVNSNQIDGRVISNQGKITADFLANPTCTANVATNSPQCTDDPTTGPTPDPTNFTLRFAPDLVTSVKLGVDVNGGLFEPNDIVRYTVRLINTGNLQAATSSVDDLPLGIDPTSFVLESFPTGATVLLTPAPAGTNNTGQVAINNLVVPPGQTREVIFTVRVAANAANGTQVTNRAAVTVTGFPNKNVTLQSPTLTVISAPDFSGVTKAVEDLNGGDVHPGETLEYTIAFTNAGNRNGTVVRVVDVVDSDLTVNVATISNGGTFNAATRTITWNLGTVTPNTSFTLRYRVQVNSPLANGTELRNQAVINSTEIPTTLSDDPSTAAPDDPTIRFVFSAPDFTEATKTATDLNGGDLAPGDTVLYTLSVTNIGDTNATAVVFQDVVDTNLTNVTVQNGGTFNAANRTITWNIPGTVTVGQSVTVNFTAQVVSPLADETLVCNQGSVDSAETTPTLTDDPVTPEDDDATCLAVTATLVFDFTKEVVDTNGGVTNPGDAIRYDLTIQNVGTSTASNVVVTDVVPAALTNVVPTAPGVFNAANRTITWTFATVGQTPTEFGFSAQVVSPLSDNTQVCNQASVLADESDDATLSDDPVTVADSDPSCVTVVSSPAFDTSTKTVVDNNGGDFNPGDTVAYTVTVINSGTANASNVVITDVVPAELGNVANISNGGTFNAGTRTITWNLATLNVNAQVALTFQADIVLPLDNGTEVANQANIGAQGVPPVPSDDPATAELDDATTFTVVSSPDFSTSTKTVQDQNGGLVLPGDTLLYTITVKNTGNMIGRRTTIRDVVDLTNLEAVVPGQGGTFDAATGTITWNGTTTPALANVALSSAGDVVLSFQARIRANVADGTEILNQANLLHEDPSVDNVSDDPATADPSDPTKIVVGIPKIVVEKTVDVVGGGAAEPLKTLSYTLRVRNDGSAAASGVAVSDVVDVTRLENITPAQGGIFDAATNTIRWNGTTTPELAVLSADEEVLLVFTASIRAGIPNGDVIANQGSLAFAELPGTTLSDDPATADANDSTKITIAATPNFSIFQKEASEETGVAPFAPGDRVLYTLRLRNTGTGFARNVVVTDVLPAELADVQPSDGGIFDVATRTVTWNATSTPALATVVVDQEVVLTISAQLVSPLVDGTTVTNQASLRDDFVAAPVLSDDPATTATADPTSFVVVSSPSFVGSPKTVEDLNGGLVQPGDSLRYTIRVVNIGTEADATVSLVDAIPAQTTYVLGSTTLNGLPVADVAGEAPFANGLAIPGPGAPLEVGDANAVEVSFVVRVDATVQEGTVISNQGLIFSEVVANPTPTDDPAQLGDENPTQVVVGSAPSLRDAAKTFDLVNDVNGNGLVDVGDRIAFVIRVSNQGVDAATEIVISDNLPTTEASYVVASLSLNGVVLSDAAGDDAGELVGDALQVRVASLAPQEIAEVRFEMDVLAEPSVVNQATIDSLQTASEETDADGNDQNGNQPTVVPVGDAGALLFVEKILEDINGGDVETGDVVLYRVVVRNEGTAEAVDVVLQDVLPAGLAFADFFATPDNADAVFEEPPAGAGQGVVRVTNIVVPAGESIELAFTATVTAEEAQEVCNTALLSEGASKPIPSEEACLTVGAASGTGGLTAIVFQDIGEDDGVYQAETDRALVGLQLKIFSKEEPNQAVASDTSSEDGLLSILGVLPGEYRAEVLTAEGTLLFGQDLTIQPDVVLEDLSFVIDPTGIVYNAETGAAVAGARVFLLFDEEDAQNPGVLVPADQLGRGQQGQRTDKLGFYQFDLQPDRKYRISVEPATATLQFPSRLVGSSEGFAAVAEENEVVSSDIPTISDDIADTYYLRLDSSISGVFHNNHLALDPLSSLLTLEKKTLDPAARMGEIVTYQIRLENRSTQDFAPNTGNDLFIQDILPKGFRFLSDSARLEHVLDGNKTAEKLVLEVGSSGRVLRAGPLTIAAGETAILTYQTAVRIDVVPGLYENTAQVFLGSTAVSDIDTAKVRIEFDPDFQESVLIGKVFCDSNANGQQELGDIGLPFARIYLDTGTYVESDLAGKYHVTALGPGMHLAKIDKNTLPPPGKLTTTESVLFKASSAIPAKANFGVACSLETVGIDQITQYGEEPATASSLPTSLPALENTSLVLSGNVSRMELSFDGEAIALPIPTVSLGTGIPVLASKGRYSTPAFKTQMKEGSGWRLRVWSDNDGSILLDKGGDGLAPSEISLDVQILAPATYRYQLLAVRGDQLLGSTVGTFVVEEGETGKEIFSFAPKKNSAFEAKTFAPIAALKDALKTAALQAPNKGELLKIEVSTDGSETGQAALEATQRRADALKTYLSTTFNVPAASIWALGVGSISTTQNVADRKVVLRIVPMDATKAAPESIKPFAAPAFVYVDTAAVGVFLDGGFGHVMSREDVGQISIDLGAKDGRRVTGFLRATKEELPPAAQGATVTGDLADGTLSIDGVAQDLALLGVDLPLLPKAKAGQGKFATPYAIKPILPAVASIAAWRLRIIDENGKDLAALQGEGAPPAEILWDGTDGNGGYIGKAGALVWAVLDVDSPSGLLVETMPRLIAVGGGAAAAKYPLLRMIGEVLGADGKLAAALEAKLKTFAAELVSRKDQFYEVGVELPMPLADAKARREAFAQASKLRDALVALGVPAEILRVTGSGSAGYADRMPEAKKAALNVARVWRVAPVEAQAMRPYVAIDGIEVSLTGLQFSQKLSGDGGLVDLRMPAGSRAILAVRGKKQAFLLDKDATIDVDFAETSKVRSTAAQPVMANQGSGANLDLLLLNPFELGAYVEESKGTAKPSPALGEQETVNPFSNQGTSTAAPKAAASQPVLDKEGTIDPFAGGGGDAPVPTRRKLGKGTETTDAPVPTRRPSTGDTGPVPTRRPGKKVAPKGAKVAVPTVVTPSSLPAVSVTAPAKLLPNLPAIGAPVAALPPGTEIEVALDDAKGQDYARFGAEELEQAAAKALRDKELAEKGLLPSSAPSEEDVAAASLSVRLPKEGLVLRGGHLVIEGDTSPKNRIKVNGQSVTVDKNGHFVTKLSLKSSDTELVIESTDTAGNVAELRRPVQVLPESYFLLALGDVALGDADAQQRDELGTHNSTQLGPLFLQGRGAVYFKGLLPGRLIFDAFKVTGHLDTARKSSTETFFDNVIDPEKYYPVFGDASQEVREAQARGPLYVLVEADASKLLLGNMKTDIKGLEFFRYDRTLYGLSVDFRESYGADKKFATEVKVFASEDRQSLHQVQNLFRGTGGSVYSLSEDELLEGGETVQIVVRDRDTGITLLQVPLRRYDDYVIDYRSGRVSLRDPLPSSVDAGFLVGHPSSGALSLNGSPVFLEVSFESEAEGLETGFAGGGYAQQRFGKIFSVGGGYVGESRGDSPSYQLWGADLQAKWSERSYFKAEYSSSSSLQGNALVSADGGATFAPLGLEDAGISGAAWKLSGAFELNDVTKKVDADGKPFEQLGVFGYWQSLTPGFSSHGSVFSQGQNKAGLQVRWNVTPGGKVTARVDTLLASSADDAFAAIEPTLRNTIGSIGYEKKMGIQTLRGEFAYLYSDDQRQTTDPLQRGVLAFGLERKLTDRWMLLGLQEAVLFASGTSSLLGSSPSGLLGVPTEGATGNTADGRFLDSTLDSFGEHLTTSLGARYQLSETLSLSALESLRWDGSNAMSLGLKTKLNESMSAYATERFQLREGEWVNTSIVGAEQRFGTDGRSYGEYHLENAASGLSERAVMGIGKRWRLREGVGVSFAYEHSQLFSDNTGDLSRDTAAAGLEWLVRENIKASAKLEFGYDSAQQILQDALVETDRLKTLATAAVTWKLTPDWTLFARALDSLTLNVSDSHPEALQRLATLGFAYRPELNDQFSLLGKLSFVENRKPTDLLENTSDTTSFMAVSLAPVFEISKRYSVAGKLAMRSETRRFEDLLPQGVATYLLGLRLDTHLTEKLDLSLEWRGRLQETKGATASEAGFLSEIAMRLNRYLRLGLGYNFTSFSDDELVVDDKNAGGLFLRMTGQY